MKTVTYIRPSNRPIEINDTEESRNLAKRMGWKEVRKRGPKKRHSNDKLDKHN